MCHCDWIRIACNGLAEERQFKTETMAVGRLEISRVIPPLGLIVGMIEVIARKLVMVPGQRESVILRPGRDCTEQDEERRRDLFFMHHLDGVQALATRAG